MERCRFCYKAVEVEFCKNIFNNEQTNPPIPKIVEMLTNLTIVENDPYTKLACLDCFNILVILYNYRETILQTNQLLIENEINMNNNKNDGNFHKNWPRIKRDDDGQFIVINNNNSANLTEATLQIKSEPDGEDHTICNNNQHSNISMDNDEEMAINDNENGTKTDNYNQQLDNSLCIKGENEQILGFIKDEIKIEDVCLKIESEPDDEGHTICINNQHSNISMDNDEEMTNNDNKNGTNINNYNEQSDENSLCIERNDERLGFAKDELEIEEICSEIDIDKATSSTLLPEKSKRLYDKAYQSFMEWRLQKKTNSFSEDILLAYFLELSDKYKASSMWSFYSMLRAVLVINHDVDIERYSKLRSFLKRKSECYEPKKSKTLTSEEIKRFITKAPDEIYLLHKVILIIGIMGACRSKELYEMQIQDVKDLGTTLSITVPTAKTKMARTFTISGLFYNIVKKYMDLRPSHAKINSFFLNYQKSKCTIQRIGKNKFATIGKQIAIYLKLPNPDQYTGHCYRRSSATLYIDGSGDVTGPEPEPHGSCKFTQVAGGYIDQSLRNNLSSANSISIQVFNREASTSNSTTVRNGTIDNVSNLNSFIPIYQLHIVEK